MWTHCGQDADNFNVKASDVCSCYWWQQPENHAFHRTSSFLWKVTRRHCMKWSPIYRRNVMPSSAGSRDPWRILTHEDDGSDCLRNVGKHTCNDAASHSRRPVFSSVEQLWKPLLAWIYTYCHCIKGNGSLSWVYSAYCGCEVFQWQTHGLFWAVSLETEW